MDEKVGVTGFLLSPPQQVIGAILVSTFSGLASTPRRAIALALVAMAGAFHVAAARAPVSRVAVASPASTHRVAEPEAPLSARPHGQGGRWRAAERRSLRTSQRQPLRLTLQDRHGWRWRYRDRWLVVAAETSRLSRVLARPDRNRLCDRGQHRAAVCKRDWLSDSGNSWLRARFAVLRLGIDRLMPSSGSYVHRPPGGKPFDTERTAQRLGRHARALRWAAPAYVLNATQLGGVTVPGAGD